MLARGRRPKPRRSRTSSSVVANRHLSRRPLAGRSPAQSERSQVGRGAARTSGVQPKAIRCSDLSIATQGQPTMSAFGMFRLRPLTSATSLRMATLTDTSASELYLVSRTKAHLVDKRGGASSPSMCLFACHAAQARAPTLSSRRQLDPEGLARLLEASAIQSANRFCVSSNPCQDQRKRLARVFRATLIKAIISKLIACFVTTE